MHQGLELRSPAHAVALSLMGWHCYARAYYREKAGAEVLTWFAAGANLATASQLLDLATLPATDERHLARQRPEHPLLACLYAQEAADSLRHWLGHPHDPPAVIRPHPQGRLLRIVRTGAGGPHDLIPLHAVVPPISSIAQIEAAAATIVGAGFVPSPVLKPTPSDGPAFRFPEQSLTCPEITLAMLPQAHVAPLPGPWEPFGHPFNWALKALQKRAKIAAVETQARRNPSILFHGVAQRRAMVSQSLMDHGPAHFKDRVGLHLDGMTQ